MDITLEPPFLIIRPFMTEEDFYRQADEDTDWEYLDGRILMHSPASDRATRIPGFAQSRNRTFDSRG